LAQVVALISPPFNVKLSVWLPTSCNAASLVAKATTKLKEVAFRQPITQYQILSCYRVSRLSLLRVLKVRDWVRMNRKKLWTKANLAAECFSLTKDLVLFASVDICWKTSVGGDVRQYQLSANSMVSGTWWPDESLELID